MRGMSIHYREYVWKNGKPYGIDQVPPVGMTYKIPADPYNKQISVEQYENGVFKKVVYDSRLLDFRHLKPENQLAWEKIAINDSLSEIRNQDDRLLFFERYVFSGDLCRECRVESAHGILLSVHKMFYVSLGDEFNGVVLFDPNEHLVMCKMYKVDETTGDFSELIKEIWDEKLCPS